MPENENQTQHHQATPSPGPAADEHTRQANQWAMFIHFSIVAGFLLPFLGLALPIVLWQLKKDEYPPLDAHGKVVVNWLISAFIYLLLSLALTLIWTGYLLFAAIALATLIFAIVGGLKARHGELWQYPLSIVILK